jgi:hypothetical protein
MYERLGFFVQKEFKGKWSGFDCEVVTLVIEA